MAAFTWGQNGQKLTPEAVARMRIANELMRKEAGSTTPVASPFAGLNRALQGFIAGRDAKRADAGEAAGLAGADAAIAGLLAGQGGGYSAPGYSASTSGAPAAAPADPNAALAADAMAALGKGDPDAAAHTGQTHAEWLRYSNQGATRNDPIDPRLVSAMSFVPEMGVTMDVVSGGQETADEIARTGRGARKGSNRHDRGQAADADFYKDGRKLDWNNPADMPILVDIIRKAKANGVTGIGAGDDYMGAGRFHVGFGNPGVWGAGGKSANAPAWLVDAYNGAPAGTTVPTYAGAGGAPVTPGGYGGTDLAALIALQSDPWVTQKYGGILDALMGQQIDRQNATWEQQQRMSDPMYQAQLQMAQLELEKAQAPAPVDPFAGTKEVGGVLYGPDGAGGFKPLITPPAAGGARPLTDPAERAAWGILPTDTRPYAIEPGKPPQVVGGGGVTVNNNMDGGKFEESFAKGDADTISTVYNAGLAAQRNLGRIDQLDAILKSSPTGFGASLAQTAGEWGINTEGLSEIQAAQAMINSLVPEQRQPGSGPMSDADLELFKQSLPRIINQPGGNQIIVDTMRAIAQYDAEGAQIVQGLRDGTYTRAEAFDALQNRKNPLADLGKDGGVSGVADAVSDEPPPGVDPADWQFMTPEEKAMFK